MSAYDVPASEKSIVVVGFVVISVINLTVSVKDNLFDGL